MYNENSYFSKKLCLLNAVLTFLIVLQHSAPLGRFGLEVNIEYPLIYFVVIFTHVAVPLFFFISALLFYRKCDFCDLKRKLHSRLYSLLIPYLLWNTVFVLIYYFITRIPIIEEHMRMGKIINNFSSFCIAILDSRFTPLWFVRNLICFNLFSPLILVVLKKMWLAILVLLLFIIIACYGNFSYQNIISWTPVYLLGAIVGKFFSYEENKNGDSTIRCLIQSNIHRNIISIFLFILFICIYLLALTDERYLFLYRLFSPLVIWFIVDFVCYKYVNYRFSKKKWMEYTFFIYCTHYFLLNVLQKITTLFLRPTEFHLNFIFLISPFIVIFLLTCLASYLSKFGFYKYLSGNR